MSYEIWRKHMTKLRETRKVKFMRRKKPSRKIESVLTFEGENSSILLYSTGKVVITGDVKKAAFGFAKHIMDNYNGYSKQIMNSSLIIRCIKGQDYSINWNTSSQYQAPERWQEFKEEFERVCKLKAFI